MEAIFVTYDRAVLEVVLPIIGTVPLTHVEVEFHSPPREEGREDM